MAKQLFSATLFFLPSANIRPRKYKNISQLERFTNFCKNTGAIYFNLYDQRKGDYIKRIWLNL